MKNLYLDKKIKTEKFMSIAIKTSEFQIFQRLISQWKPRCKKIKYKIKDLAKDAGIVPQHLTKIITGKYVTNPRVRTIEAVENALCAKEEEFVKQGGRK